MADVDISGAQRKFQAAGINVHRAMPRLLARLAGSGERKMKRLVPVDTGNLKNSIASVVYKTSAEISASANYARYVNDGTRPHIIRPRNAKCLAFAPYGARDAVRGGSRTGVFSFGGKSVDVGLVCVKEVHHPGTKGVHFVENTEKYIIKIIPSATSKVIKEALRNA